MVKANGQPTRARIREEHTGFCRIDGSHRFMRLKSPQDQVQYEQYITYVRNALKTLSPATRRVLDAVRAALLVSYDEKRGYKFKGFVNRAAIAAHLGRQTLVPYDIKMLRLLAEKRLITEYTHPLPRKQYGDIWLGSGAEFVYHISSDVLYCLLMVDAQESARLAALRPPLESASLRNKQESQKPNAQPGIERHVKAYVPVYQDKPTFWERLMSVLGL